MCIVLQELATSLFLCKVHWRLSSHKCTSKHSLNPEAVHILSLYHLCHAYLPYNNHSLCQHTNTHISVTEAGTKSTFTYVIAYQNGLTFVVLSRGLRKCPVVALPWVRHVAIEQCARISLPCLSRKTPKLMTLYVESRWIGLYNH